jgi:hypothetical protein
MFSYESAWTIFRFGPTPFIPYENTQFPIAAQEQYFAQIVPNTETSYAESRSGRGVRCSAGQAMHDRAMR